MQNGDQNIVTTREGTKLLILMSI